MPRTERFRQWLLRPERQRSHRPQTTLISPTTRLPISSLSDDRSTWPTNSWPRIPWNPMYPLTISRSVAQMPACRTRTSVSPATVGGSARLGWNVSVLSKTSARIAPTIELLHLLCRRRRAGNVSQPRRGIVAIIAIEQVNQASARLPAHAKLAIAKDATQRPAHAHRTIVLEGIRSSNAHIARLAGPVQCLYQWIGRCHIGN